MKRKQIGIYIHIPFCVRKCNYCDFLSFSADESTKEEYVKALISQIEACRDTVSEYEVATVYFGGGTPSVLTLEQTERIVQSIKDNYHIDFEKEGFECTTEVNPGTVTKEKLRAYRNAGINRLSVGVQSACDAELAALGRIHSFAQAEECIKMAREAGFTNISMDLISALPDQTIESYRDSVEKILALRPTHISSYSLIVEEGTPFFDLFGPEGSEVRRLPDEDTEREMYYLTEEMLEKAGFRRYEISNYALPGYESKHNSSYWEGRDYLGLGLGASSLLKNVRYRNTEDLNEYLSAPCTRSVDEVLDEDALMREYMILGLRKTRGVSIAEFSTRFGRDIFEVFGKEINKSIQEGLMEQEEDAVRLTKKGLDVSNYVMERFI